MAAIQPNVLETAKQGNPKAIATLMNHSLKAKGVTVKAFIQGSRLNIMLEAANVPPQAALMAFTKQGIQSLGLQTSRTVRVHGRQEGADMPAWVEEFDVATYKSPTPEAQDTMIVTASTIHPLQQVGQTLPHVPSKAIKLAIPKSGSSIPWIPLSIGTAVFAFVGMGGGVLWLRTTQANLLSQSQALTQSVGEQEASGDIAALRTDQDQLQRALSLLEKAPKVPLLGLGAVNTELELVRNQLTTVTEEIIAYEALLPEFTTVMDQFAALDSGLDVGMNYRDYGSEIRQLKAALDRLGRQPGAQDFQVYGDLEETYRHYEFAHSVWQYYVESDERHNFFSASSSYGRLLVSNYEVETTDIIGTPKIYLNDALSAVWQAASQTLESAQGKI